MSDAPNNPPPEGQAPPPGGTPPGGAPPPGGQAPPPGGQPPGGQAPPPGGQPPGGQAPPPGGQPPASAGQTSSPGGSAAGNQAGQPGDLGTRILAKVIDSIIVGIVVGPLWAGISIALAFTGLPGFFTRLVTYSLATAIYIGYFAYMESSKGQTVGKMLMKLEVRGPNGGQPTMEQAAKRNAYFGVLLIGIIPFIGWFLYPLAYIGAIVYLIVTINNNEQTRQGWHDEFAGGTWVLKTA